MGDTAEMLLSQRQTDVSVMFLSAAGGAIVGVAAEAWWWVVVGVAGLAVAAYLLFLRSRQNDANEWRAAQVADIVSERRIREIFREEVRSALIGRTQEAAARSADAQEGGET